MLTHQVEELRLLILVCLDWNWNVYYIGVVHVFNIKIRVMINLKKTVPTMKKKDYMKQEQKTTVNPLRPNSDLSQTSHCNIKGLSVSEVMRIENMITQVKFY